MSAQPQETTAPMASTRYTVHFAGHVQGVGFRWTAQRVAQSHHVAGYVQNLPDGRVKLVAEGEASELDALVEAIENAMAGNIRSKMIDRSAANGEFGQPGDGLS